MIVPMKKYVFAVHHAAYRHFLDELQELGVVHVGKSSGKTAGGEAAPLNDEAARIRYTLDQLNRFREADTPDSRINLAPGEIIGQTATLLKQLEAGRSKLERLAEKTEIRAWWGDYSESLIGGLQEAGVPVSFYVVPAKKFNPAWPDEYPMEIISRLDKEIRFVTFGVSGEMFEGARREDPGKQTVASLKQEIRQTEQQIAAAERELQAMASGGIRLLQQRLEEIEVRLEWLDVWDNLTTRIGEGAVHLLEGWVPVTEEARLKEYLNQRAVFYLDSAAGPDEKPPVQLHNNRFGRLFEPISRLFSLPAYTEMDLTVYFAPFFMLFFGFCLGDAGYGLVILLGATFYKRFAAEKLKGYLVLGQLFGASTLVMGILFGTFFGIELAKVSALSGVKELFLESSQVFALSLMVGAVQILFGIVLRIKNQLRQAYRWQALSSAGWLLLFATAGLFAFLLKGEALSPVLKMTEKFLYAASVLMILFFSGSGPLHLRLVGGLWEMYNTVTGIFGDLLSYIRLFALGIASSILGLVINQMAISFGSAKYIGPVIFILFVVVGHTANLAISSLGAFVHPMRLTFVEFYKNAGFQGGGKPYQPFSKQRNHLSTT